MNRSYRKRDIRRTNLNFHYGVTQNHGRCGRCRFGPVYQFKLLVQTAESLSRI